MMPSFKFEFFIGNEDLEFIFYEYERLLTSNSMQSVLIVLLGVLFLISCISNHDNVSVVNLDDPAVLNQTNDYANSFYTIASNYYATRISNHSKDQRISRLHLMRIPKASSSSLSMIARRIVNCSPPGPCCRYPGVPKGSCPVKGLDHCERIGKVIGCTNHFPNLQYLFKSSMPSVTMIRNPFSRSISGFFYPGVHHNSDCKGDLDECFGQYLKNKKWKNILVKMLTGSYPYAPVTTCTGNASCRFSLEQAATNMELFSFVGVAELWELSILLMHYRLPYTGMIPQLSEFRLGGGGGNANLEVLGQRVNMKPGYVPFKASILSTNRYRTGLHEQNALDAVLYRKAVHRMCLDLHTYALWQTHKEIPLYWAEKSPLKTKECP